jgi:hypothetical protein
VCDPELIACTTTCPCWSGDIPNVGGHTGHCCFLRDNHANPPTTRDWRTGDDECQPPTTVPTEVPC